MFVSEKEHGFHIFAWKNVVFIGRKPHLLNNKEVKDCHEIFVMLPFVIYLTSHIYGNIQKYSLMSHSWNYPFQMITSRLVCWIQIAKIWNESIKHGKNDADVDHRSWQRHFFYKQKCFWDYQWGKQMCFCQEQGTKYYQAVLTVYQLGTFSERGSWIHHNLQGL